jgi:myo-inositol-1(or 4)-monophosphatase
LEGRVLDEYLDFGRELALDAGDAIRQGFGGTRRVTYKADGSPVTDVDIRVNQLVIDRIRGRYPGHAVLGEERDFGTGFESCQWICDPLDGTVPYLLGLPNSLFMIALADESGLLMAVAYDPFVNRMYHATRSGGAFCNGSPIHVSACGLSDGCVVLGSDSLSFADAVRQAGGRVESVPGSGYKSMMVARGEAVALIRATADFHDLAPAALIVAEAGGQVTALSGLPVDARRSVEGGVIISNGRAHPALVALARAR